MNRFSKIGPMRHAAAIFCSTLLAASAWAQVGTLNQPLPLSKQNPGQYTYQPSGTVIFNSLATSFPGHTNLFSAGACDVYPCNGVNNAWTWVATNPTGGSGYVYIPGVTDPVTGQPSLHITAPTGGSYVAGTVMPWPIETQIKIPLVAPYITAPVQSTGSVFKRGKRYQIKAVITPGPGTVPGLLRIGIGETVQPYWAVRTFLIAPANVSAPVGTKAVGCTANSNGSFTCTYSFTFNRPDTTTGSSVLFLIPQVAGMDAYVNSIRIDEISADPFNLAADLPRPPNLSGTNTVGSLLMGLKFGNWGYNGGVWPSALGASVNRLWDTGTYWGALQPNSGSSGWSTSYQVMLDQWTLFDDNYNKSTLLTLGLTPPWATAANACGTTAYKSPPGCYEPPTSLSDWSAYVTKVALDEQGRIQYFELWNEPDANFNPSGTSLQLADLAKSARLALNSAQSQLGKPLKLVGPSPTIGGMDELDRFLAAGGGDQLDAFSFHAYFSPLNAESQLSSTTANLKLALNDYGYGNKPVWNTETGAECDAGTLAGCPGNATPTQDATRGIMPRAVAAMVLNGVTNFDYYHVEGTDNATQPWRALATVNPNPVALSTNSIGYGNPQYTILTDNGTGYQIASGWLSSTAQIGPSTGQTTGTTTNTGWQVAYNGTTYPVYVMPIYNGGKQQYLVWNYSSSPLCVTVPASDWGLKGIVNFAYTAKVHTLGVNPSGTTVAGEDTYRLNQPTYAPAGSSAPAAWNIWLMPYSPVLLTPQ